MIDADVLRAMAAAGASIEVIIAAVEADAAKEQARRDAKRENNAERQRRFKAKRKGKTPSNAGNALPGVTPPNDIYSNPPVSSDEETTAAPKSKSPAKPEGVSAQTWADFQSHRKAIKAPASETALAAIQREATAAGWTMEAALAEVVARGWRGFKAEWVRDSTGPPGKPAEPASFLAHLVEKDRQRQQVSPA